MAKKFTGEEILKMAVGLIPEDMSADLDFDGKITSADARFADRKESSLKPLGTAAKMAENTVNRIIKDTDSYSYSTDDDPLYSQYRMQYEKEGSLAAEDALGKASALTGGYGSSYGQKIASDTRAEFARLTADKAEELEKTAFERHRNSVDALYKLYSLLSDEEKKEQDRQLAALDFAVLASEMGDDSFIKALGIEPEDDDFKKLKEMAELSAKYGDYSYLKALGIDTSKTENKEKYSLAELFAKYGDYSLLKELGADTENIELEEYYDRLLKKQKVW